MNITAVGFDAAGTLFHNAALDAHLSVLDDRMPVLAAVQVVGSRGLWPEDTATDDARAAAWSLFYEQVFTEARCDGPQASRLGRECGDLVADPAGYRLFDDVTPMLDHLDRLGLGSCVISNFDPLLALILDRLDLTGRFRVVVSSWEVGCYKPDPVIFRMALARMGVPAEGLLYVGDSPATDVKGATACGIRAVLIDRDDRHSGHTGPRIRQLTDLLDHVEAAS